MGGVYRGRSLAGFPALCYPAKPAEQHLRFARSRFLCHIHMLKLHSLEISGFKSFLEKVEVRFAPGITAIVGPNGCGKSNLSDAITWVLGEQSAKSLRGDKMEDVIFNGTDKRAPVGMAEVSLTLETDPSSEHAVDGMITLQRQVFRSGEGRYRINGKTVRLRDLKDLLMDTGLGIRAYSVIEQGKIGMILSGKPQERRRLIEEAAGITRYRERKRVAEIKLEETLANLLRIDDIVAEVDRALRSLKRQAGAARRYQQVEKEYRELLHRVLLGRWAHQKSRLDGLETRLAAATDREAALLAELHKGEAELVYGREQLDQHSKELGARHQAYAQLAATIEGRQEFLKGARQRAVELDERLKQGRHQAEERRRQTAEFQLSVGSLDERARDLLAERDEAARAVAEDDARISAAQKDVAGAEARLEGLRQELLASAGQVNTARSGLQKEVVEIERLTYRARYLEEERLRLDKQLQENSAAAAKITEKVQADEKRLADFGETRGAKQRELDTLLRREAELQDERRQLEAQLAGLRQRQRMLAELSKEHHARRKVLVERLKKIGIHEPRFLADQAHAAPEWADGIDHFLGELADAILLGPDEDALALARSLSADQGSGTFLRALPQAPRAAEIEDEALAWSLAEALDLPDDIARALPPAYLVRRAVDAQRLAAEHPGVAFISRERVWAQGGFLRVQGEASAPGVLARENEIQAIAQEIPRLEQRVAEVVRLLQSIVEGRGRLAGEIHRLDEQAGEVRREIAVAQARRQDAESRRKKVDDEHRKITNEQAELNAQIETRKARRATLQAELEAGEARHAELTATFDRGQLEVEASRERRESLRTEGAGRRGRLALLEERLASQNTELLRMRRQITFTEEQLQTWEREDGSLGKRLAELRQSIEAAETELQDALDRRSDAQEKVLEQQAVLDQHRENLRRLEEAVQQLRARRDEVRGELEGLRVDRAGLRQDAEHLSVTFRDQFKKYLPGTAPKPPEQLALPAMPEPEPAEPTEEEAELLAVAEAAGEGPDEEDEPAEAVMVEDDSELPNLSLSRLAELEGELARTKESLERLGPVNVLAAEEFDEQNQRYDFLSQQRRDINDSVTSLRNTIAEIDQTSSERFKATFEAVNAVFGQTFAKLFRGGEAEMRLFDETDLLETGIEIVARPPGKRPQNIMLLSGGEKALTAIALLFALFQSKPSPLCILDEVDAPLDDVNVSRFVEVLQEMSEETQFLVVTHNKLSMEAASTLYGVTMEEKGVSKLVRAALDELHPVREPEAAILPA
jgi:chromosome segregation protein